MLSLNGAEASAPATTFRWRYVAMVALHGLFAAAIFVLLMETGGQITYNEGMGWDGAYYAAMTSDGLASGTANTALRPLVPFVNRWAYAVLGNAVAAFQLMNVIYSALFAVGLALLLDAYGARPVARLFFVATAAVSIATAQMMAFYPVLIDLGAYAAMTFAIVLVLRGSSLAAAIACVVAVLSREFGIAVVAFGLVRGVRQRVPWLRLLATYAPACAVFVLLRVVISWADPRDASLELVTAERLAGNLRFWQDPLFAGLFLYFLVTVLGGVSLALASRPGACLRVLWNEPEWLAFTGLVLAATAVGSADLWRYLGFLTPVMAVLFARLEAGWSGWRRPVLLAQSVGATWLTQRPFGAMDLGRYFRDWFPYYVVIDQLPRGV
ncbi:MAG TPA: hypothetical protein VGQ37_17195, partial [Vicinamibacterales bacterium]|nr:hypothetical protein [Vicinamibacterales bacterium]